MPAGCQSEARVLLVEPHRGLRQARAQKLLELGYRVSALPDTTAAPASFAPHLYDVIVVSVTDSLPLALHWCERVAHSRGKPLIVIVSTSLFSLDAKLVPSVVISEDSERAVEQKLVAFLRSTTSTVRAEAVP